VFDRKSGKLIKKVALSDHPNNISVTKNGDRIVVAIARGKGGLDIVDAATLTLKKTISANGGRLHKRLRDAGQQNMWLAARSRQKHFMSSTSTRSNWPGDADG